MRQPVRSALSSDGGEERRGIIEPALVQGEHAEIAERVAECLIRADTSRLGGGALEEDPRLLEVPCVDRDQAAVVQLRHRADVLAELAEHPLRLGRDPIRFVELSAELVDDREVPERARDARRVAEPAEGLECPFAELQRAVEVGDPPRERRRGQLDGRDERRRKAVRALERPVEPACSLAEVSRRLPDVREVADEPDGTLVVARRRDPVERGAQVVELALDRRPADRDTCLVGTADVVREAAEVLGVPVPELRFRLGALFEAGERVRADRLEHREARLAVGLLVLAEQAVVEQRRDAREGPSAPQTASAASSVQPPAKTASLAKSARSSGPSRS